MSKVKNAQFWESAKYNNATFVQYYRRIVELSMSMFKWSGLPDTVDPRFIELTLFAQGGAIYFNDEVMGNLCLQFTTNGGFTVYREPLKRRAYAVNGYKNNELDEKNSVIIWNNMLRTSSMLEAEIFAKRLWDLDRTVDVNVHAQKTPILIVCEEDELLTAKNLYMKYDGNEPVIMGRKSIKGDMLQVLKTDAPYIADKVYNLKMQIWNECLTWLGISNINITKKERMITDEVTRNMGGTIASRYSRLNARQEACERINKMFGLNASCEYRDDLVVTDFNGEPMDIDTQGQNIADTYNE